MKADCAIVAIIFVMMCMFVVPVNAATTVYNYPEGNVPTWMMSDTWYTSTSESYANSAAHLSYCNATYGPTQGAYSLTAAAVRITSCVLAYNYTANSSFFATCPSAVTQYTGYPGSTYYFNSANQSLVWAQADCSYEGQITQTEIKSIFHRSLQSPPGANFTGAPLEAVAPEYVSFTDTSTNETGTCTYNWSFSPETGVMTAPQDLDNEDITVLFTQNGNFTVSHGVSCAAGSDIETKSDYVHIVNASELATFRIRAVDAVSGYGINGATVSAYDIENASWANQTTTTGEVSVTALTGHTANAYGTASGYDDGESLALPVYQGALYPIYMYPSNFGRNASAGNVTLYITVLEEGTNTRLSGMAVSLSASGGGASYTAGTTNDNGIFQIVVPNKTTYLVSVLKQKGYLGASKSVYTGTQSGGDAYVEETIWLQKDSVTPTVTATTLPGGGTPTTVQTVDPYPCVGDGSYQDTLNCQRKQGEMGADIIAYGPDLVKFFIMLTFIGGLLLIGKRR